MFIQTIKDRCRVCYTCVRECPAKAIRISEGQAEILAERCICCGNCVRVCSQGAKQIVSTVDEVNTLIASGSPVAACVAPSFPAEFTDIDPGVLAAMLRKLGFALVIEVGFGADLVADRYRRLAANANGKGHIATSCPALVEFVERYQPELVPRLAPIVSPMVALGRTLRRIHGSELKIVFVGPCIAKKREVRAPRAQGAVDEAITFVELRQMFQARGITPEHVTADDFDPPRAGLGALFPISRGLLQAAGLKEDLLTGNVVVTDGRANFAEALREFATGELETNLLEILCCTGCIMGPGMTTTANLYGRRAAVSRYMRNRASTLDWKAWEDSVRQLDDLDLSCSYETHDQRVLVMDEPTEVRQVLARMGKTKPEDELNCGACGYDTCRLHAIAIIKGLAESEMCLPYTIEQLRKALSEVADSEGRLASTRAALMQAERLASMGQLAAGVAHEVNNPLGVVLLYSHLLLDEIKDEALRKDLGMIVEQADRCKKIVSGLLNFARQNKVVLEPVDLHELAEHSILAMQLPPEIDLHVQCQCDDPVAEIDRDQITQVLTNLVTNAADAMRSGGQLDVEVRGDEQTVYLVVRDTGAGIPPESRGKIFEPFFTTKQIDKGTGLGLAITYGIVKMHRGSISVESSADPAAGPTGSTFTVGLPRRAEQE